MTAALALEPREDDIPDDWPGWTGLRIGADHTHHADHPDREAVHEQD